MPVACHAPIIVIKARHVTSRGATPPMNFAACSSAIIAAHCVEIVEARHAQEQTRCVDLQ